MVGIPLQFHFLEPIFFFHADFLFAGEIRIWNSRLGGMGLLGPPAPYHGAQNDYTRIYFIWEFVTQGFLAGIILCNSGAFIDRYFLWMRQLHTLIVWELDFQLHAYLLHRSLGIKFPIASISVTQKNCFRIVGVMILHLEGAPETAENRRFSQETELTPYPNVRSSVQCSIVQWSIVVKCSVMQCSIV